MTPRQRKSTKRFDANSSPTPRKPLGVVLLIDECLGRYAVPEALKAAGATVLLHCDMFPPGIKDAEWLSQLSARSDISVLSKDRNIRKRTIEHDAVIAGRVRLFTLTVGGARGDEQAAAFCRALKRILRMSHQPGPFIASVTLGGVVRIVADGRPMARRIERRRRREGRKK